MLLFDFNSGRLRDMPVPPEVLLLCSGIRGRLGRFFFLNKFISKMAGLVFYSGRISRFLYRSGIAGAMNRRLIETFIKFRYDNLNEAFVHRHDRKLYPLNRENRRGNFISSPADSYLSIRSIDGEVVEFFPGVYVNIPRMTGIRGEETYLNGRLFVFTLKPHHGHTVDFPLDSRIVSGPREFNKKRVFVGSTDLEFIRHSPAYKRAVYEENHRVVTVLEAVPSHEKYLFIEIGANVVNSIEQDFDPDGRLFPRGSRKSHFNFGSTVILIFPQSLMEKFHIIQEILGNSTGNRTCEVNRGTVLLYSREIHLGEFQVSGRVTLTIGHGHERLTRKISQ